MTRKVCKTTSGAIFCAISFLSLAACISFAAEKNPHLWEPKTTSVAVFKQDAGFFIREGDVKLRDGWCVSSTIPPATFGTLAIYSHGDNTVDVIGTGPGEIVKFDGVEEPDTLEARRKRLEALRDLSLELTYTQNGSTESTAAGKLVGLGPTYAILEHEQNSFAVPIENISKLQVLNLPMRVHVLGEDETSPQSAKIGMAYLRKGITWIPEYTLEILDKEKARLTLRGTLINQAEDLIHCDANFVVGVPHFLHMDHLTPLAV